MIEAGKLWNVSKINTQFKSLQYNSTVVVLLFTAVQSSQCQMNCSESTSVYKSFRCFLLWHMLCKSQHFNITLEIPGLRLDCICVQCVCAWFWIGTSNLEHNKQLFPSPWGTTMGKFHFLLTPTISKQASVQYQYQISHQVLTPQSLHTRPHAPKASPQLGHLYMEVQSSNHHCMYNCRAELSLTENGRKIKLRHPLPSYPHIHRIYTLNTKQTESSSYMSVN